MPSPLGSLLDNFLATAEKVSVEDGEYVCILLYHSGVVDNSGRHDVAIVLNEAAQAICFAIVKAIVLPE